MNKFWTALEDHRVEHLSAQVRRWAMMAACILSSAFLLWRLRSSEDFQGSLTVSLFCGVTSLLLLFSALGVALHDPSEAAEER